MRGLVAASIDAAGTLRAVRSWLANRAVKAEQGQGLLGVDEDVLQLMHQLHRNTCTLKKRVARLWMLPSKCLRGRRKISQYGDDLLQDERQAPQNPAGRYVLLWTDSRMSRVRISRKHLLCGLHERANSIEAFA